MKNVLLVEPNFPYPRKSKNRANAVHKNFVPVGLLKLGAYYRSKGSNVKLVRGNKEPDYLDNIVPDLILVTSLFTYWSKYVWEAVEHYRGLFPKSKIMIGGIYVTLHHDKDYFKKKLKKYNAKCYVGLHTKAEQFYPDYDLLDSDIAFHVTHAMRGCIRRCDFCGTWKIEPVKQDKAADELINEIKVIGKNKVIFYDNNFLANQHIVEILEKIADLKIMGKPLTYESQSGFDGRLLEANPQLAFLLRKAHFNNIRIAWDNGIGEKNNIEKQINILLEAGFHAKDIFVFMIYNYKIPFEQLLAKIEYCKKWGVQIADCRYRPLDSITDNYNPHHKASQSSDDYYIHEQSDWTDDKIREFRKKVRQHNIWIRYAKDKGREYDQKMEKWGRIKNTLKYFNINNPPKMEDIQESIKWKNRLQQMKIIKKYYVEKNIKPPDLNGSDYKNIDKKLNLLLADIMKLKELQ